MCEALRELMKEEIEKEKDIAIREGHAKGREEGRAEGRAEGREEGRLKEIFLSVQEGDYGIRRGAEKLGISEAEFEKRMAEAGF